MEEAKMFHLLWKKFTDTNVLRENSDKTHKVLYQRADGSWVLKYAEGMVIAAQPTIEELMLEAVLAATQIDAALATARKFREGD